MAFPSSRGSIFMWLSILNSPTQPRGVFPFFGCLRISPYDVGVLSFVCQANQVFRSSSIQMFPEAALPV